MKVTLSEIKIYRETVEGMKPRIKLLIWKHKEEVSIQPEEQEENNF